MVNLVLCYVIPECQGSMLRQPGSPGRSKRLLKHTRTKLSVNWPKLSGPLTYLEFSLSLGFCLSISICCGLCLLSRDSFRLRLFGLGFALNGALLCHSQADAMAQSSLAVTEPQSGPTCCCLCRMCHTKRCQQITFRGPARRQVYLTE
jgi:hypothetical protein